MRQFSALSILVPASSNRAPIFRGVQVFRYSGIQDEHLPRQSFLETRIPEYLNTRHLLPLLFQFGNLVYPPNMPLTLREWGFEEYFDYGSRHLRAYNSPSYADYI